MTPLTTRSAWGIAIGTLILLIGIAVSVSRSLPTTTLPSPTLTPRPEPSLQVASNSGVLSGQSESIQVARVIDGDTIELKNGNKVRYIGIDTPETSDPRTGIQCFGREAYERNRQLVENAYITLEKDVSETDRYGRLLRYVYKDGVMVNELLVKEGFARSSSYPPDVAHQDLFRTAEAAARVEGVGLWGTCTITPTITITPTRLPTSLPSPRPTSSGQSATSAPATVPPQPPPSSSTSYTCDCSKGCKEISSCDEAQYQLTTCGCSARDGDKDGMACDGAPLNCEKR